MSSVPNQTFQGIQYVDITKKYKLLPTSKQIVDNKWTRRLQALSIPAAVCRFTAIDDVMSLDRRRGRKSVWVPKKMWNAIEAGCEIRPEDIPEVTDLVRQDGFVNLQKLCSLSGKRVDNVLNSTPVKKFSTALASERSAEVIVKEDGAVPRTWVHPRLADYIAFTGNTSFAIAATRWIDAAKCRLGWVSKEHSDMLQQVAMDGKTHSERKVRDALFIALGGGGKKEVIGPGIRCDIVTDSTVIEVKHAKDLTHAAAAIGQVSLYHGWHPTKQKRVHLFGTPSEIDVCRNSSMIEFLACHNQVELTFEEFIA
jgi:hypothetical protein